MHLSKPDSGFMGSVPIIAATIPLAVGASFDAKRRGIDAIGVAYLGDGAAEEGIFHESLNLSKVLSKFVLLILELLSISICFIRTDFVDVSVVNSFVSG